MCARLATPPRATNRSTTARAHRTHRATRGLAYRGIGGGRVETHGVTRGRAIGGTRLAHVAGLALNHTGVSTSDARYGLRRNGGRVRAPRLAACEGSARAVGRQDVHDDVAEAEEVVAFQRLREEVG
jgi:hypothetical protein